MITYLQDEYGRKFKRVNGTLFMRTNYTFYGVRNRTVQIWSFSNYTGQLEEI